MWVQWCCRYQERNTIFAAVCAWYFQSWCSGLLLQLAFILSSSLTLPSHLNYCLLPLCWYFTEQMKSLRLPPTVYSWLHWHVMTEDWQPLSVLRPSLWRQSGKPICAYLIDSYNPGSWLTTTYTHKSLCAWSCISVCACVPPAVSVLICVCV